MTSQSEGRWCDICSIFFDNYSNFKRHTKNKKDQAHDALLRERLRQGTSSQQYSNAKPNAGNISTKLSQETDDDTPPLAEIVQVLVDREESSLDEETEAYEIERLQEALHDYEVPEGFGEEDLFRFVPEPGEERISETDSEQLKEFRRVLNAEEEGFVTEEYEGAAERLGVNINVHDRWKALFGSKSNGSAGDGGETVSDPSPYKPFALYLDWKVAHWAITEKVSQKAVNRLLGIPEVSFWVLFL
jgi:hypothetical protein